MTTVIGHDWYVHRNIVGGWEWSCSCGGSGAMATEDAATERGYQHEGTDRSSLLAEVDRLRKIEAGRVALFARLDVRDELGYFDKDMTTGELRGFFGGSS